MRRVPGSYSRESVIHLNSSPIQHFFQEHTCRLLHYPRSIWYMFRYINSVTSLYFRYRPIWGMCPRGLLKYAYLLNSLPSCLLLIPCSPPWCQIAKFLGSKSIRHRSHASTPDRCLIDVDSRHFLSGVLCWPVLSGVVPQLDISTYDA